MKKIKTFAHVLKNSFNKNYYPKLENVSGYFALKYLLVFSFLSLFFFSVLPSLKLAKTFIKFPDYINTALVANNIDDLNFKFENKKLSINRESPFIIPNKEFINKNAITLEINDYSISTKTDNLFVYDEKATFEDFKNYNTSVLVTEDNLFAYSDTGKIDILDFSKSPISSFDFNIDELPNIVEDNLKYLIFLFPIFLFLSILALPFLILLYLFFSILLSLLVLFFSAISKKPTSYSIILKKSFVFLTPIALLSFICSLIGGLFGFNLTFTFWFLLFALSYYFFGMKDNNFDNKKIIDIKAK